MNRPKKLELLQSMSEKKLTKDVLIPMYEAMGCKSVRYNHGVLEAGKDIVYKTENELGETVWVGVQVKAEDIGKGKVADLAAQVKDGLNEPFTDLKKRKVYLNRFTVLTSGTIKDQAKTSFWNQFENLWAQNVIDLIDETKLLEMATEHLPQAFFDGYDDFDKYFTAMKEEFEKIKDVSALGQRETIPLDEIYVKLKLTEEESKYPKRIEKDFKISITENEKKQDTQKTGKRQTQIMDADQVVKDYRHLVIVGPPGSGKTTLLKHLALKACKENLEEQERISVPIYVNIREFSDDGSTLENYLNKVFEKFKFPKAKKHIKKDLKAGKCRLLLDGFDELATKTRQDKVAKEILGFAGKHRNCQVIASSRIAGYHNELTGFTKLELLEFDDRQIDVFVEKWFEKNNLELGKVMLKEIKSTPNIKRLARNPLMITIIAIIYEEEKQLPHRRSELYERCIDVLLSRWDKKRKIENIFKPEDKKLFLRLLALYGHKNDEKVFAKKEIKDIWGKNYKRFSDVRKGDFNKFLSEIWERSHLLRPISRNTYDFLHLSFQEYFTALELTKKSESGLKTICKFVDKHWWEEPILLYAGILNDASGLINAIKENVPEDIFHSNLRLFGKCVADAPQTDASRRDSVNTDLWRLYATPEFELLERSALEIFAYAKPSIIIDNFVKRLNLKQTSIRMDAAEVLGEIGGEKAVKPLINALKDKDSDVRVSAAYALGKIGDEKAVMPLINALKDKDSDVRVSAAYALGEIGGEKAVKLLINALKDRESDVRESAAYALGKIGGEKAVKLLINALKDKNSYVRWRTAEALGKIGSEKAVKPLINALKDKDGDVRWRAAYTLGNIGGEKAVKPLINALKDKDGDVRRSAAYTLGDIGGERAVKPLINALKDKDGNVRRSAAEALGKIGRERALLPLINAFKDKESNVRRSAAEALGKIGGEKAVKLLINALKDRDRYVGRSAAEALGNIGAEMAVIPLINAFKDEDGVVRWSAAYALGKIGSEKAVTPLINALKDEESDVRLSAAYALSKNGGEMAVIPLINALKDEDGDVRRSAAYALSKNGGEMAVIPLINALKDKESDVRWSAAEALGKIGGEKAIIPLINALKDEDSDVRGSAAEALSNIGGEKAVRPILKILNDITAKDWRKYKDDAFRALYGISRNTGIRIKLERLKTK